MYEIVTTIQNNLSNVINRAVHLLYHAVSYAANLFISCLNLLLLCWLHGLKLYFLECVLWWVACPCNVYRYEYYWCDGVNYKKPTKLPATQYIELLMDWVETQINNEDLFPQTVGMLHVLVLSFSDGVFAVENSYLFPLWLQWYFACLTLF